MTDETAAAIRETRRDFISDHRDAYLKSGGTEGHVMDITAVGGHAFTTALPDQVQGPQERQDLHHAADLWRHRRRGRDLSHRRAAPTTIRTGTSTSRKAARSNSRSPRRPSARTWREPQGDEREKIWDFMVDVFPFYANYQASTDRQIPLVMMKAIESIPVFKESDATGMRQF